MQKLNSWAGVLALVAVIIALGAYYYPADQGAFGAVSGTTNYDTLVLSDDLTVGDDATVTDDLTVSGGTFTVTTAANATSTLTVGCVQTYATSSATAVKLAFTLSGTTTLQGFAPGAVAWLYGTCP